MRDCIVIKSYITSKFEVEIYQDRYGRYVIKYGPVNDPHYSEWITDFIMASYMFDLKIQDLEGN